MPRTNMFRRIAVFRQLRTIFRNRPSVFTTLVPFFGFNRVAGRFFAHNFQDILTSRDQMTAVLRNIDISTAFSQNKGFLSIGLGNRSTFVRLGSTLIFKPGAAFEVVYVVFVLLHMDGTALATVSIATQLMLWVMFISPIRTTTAFVMFTTFGSVRVVRVGLIVFTTLFKREV